METPFSNIVFSEFFAKGQLETLAEPLEIDGTRPSITVGIPKESMFVENRIGLIPNSIRSLIGYGFDVLVEAGAGEKSHYSDLDFTEAGARVVYDKKEVFQSQIIIKIAPPSLDELDLLTHDQIIISPLHLPMMTEEYFKKLIQKKATGLAMEYLQSRDGSFPVVRIMSEIAGMTSVFKAAELLSNTNGGRGILLGGVTGVPPSKIVILGAGMVAEHAVKTALGLGASIRVFDNDVTKLMRLQSNVGRQLHTSSINPVYLAYQLTSADVVIGAIHSKHGRTPILVTEEMVSKMKEGSVIIDVSIDQGGCFETSRMTSLDKPTYSVHGVTHYCVPNIASQVGRTASIAISNILTPLLVNICDARSIDKMLYMQSGIRNGCYTYKGYLTNEYIAKRFNFKYTNLELLLTSIS